MNNPARVDIATGSRVYWGGSPTGKRKQAQAVSKTIEFNMPCDSALHLQS
jgi:hypothetical protein